jgi:hypothetical protein
MDESIIAGVVIGVMVAVASGYVSHVLRKREMEAFWAEEERRRKSDRRRELCERDLNIVRDSVDAVEEAMGGLVWGDQEELLADLLREAFLRQVKAFLVTISLGDEKLRKSCEELGDGFGRCIILIDTGTATPKEGKEDEYREAAEQTHRAAAEVLRRISEILEEV